MSNLTLEELKKKQQKLKEQIRVKEAELKRAERRKRAHVLIQCGAVIFSETTMKKHGWNLSDIEEAMKDPARFRTMILKALEPLPTTKTQPVRQPLTTTKTTTRPTTTARPQPSGSVGVSGGRPATAQPAGEAVGFPVRQSVPPPPKQQ